MLANASKNTEFAPENPRKNDLHQIDALISGAGLLVRVKFPTFCETDSVVFNLNN